MIFVQPLEAAKLRVPGLQNADDLPVGERHNGDDPLIFHCRVDEGDARASRRERHVLNAGEATEDRHRFREVRDRSREVLVSTSGPDHEPDDQ
jgi:hypothetical protein